MGLKWFRARLTMNRKSKGSSGRPEFYRSMSQFDSDVQFPGQQSSASGENRVAHSIHSVPTSPGSFAHNPMSTLNSQQSETSSTREDNRPKARARKEWQTSSDEEPGSPDDASEIPRHLPRESIELMRGENAEASPRQLVARSRRTDFKKKKAKAPMPNTTSNGLEDGRRSIHIDKGRGSDGSEIEI